MLTKVKYDFVLIILGVGLIAMTALTIGMLGVALLTENGRQLGIGISLIAGFTALYALIVWLLSYYVFTGPSFGEKTRFWVSRLSGGVVLLIPVILAIGILLINLFL